MGTRTVLQSRTTSIIAGPSPPTQTQLLLHEAGHPHEVSKGRKIPDVRPGELLVEVHAIGLNPIDWKSAYVVAVA